jgi:internalin A
MMKSQFSIFISYTQEDEKIKYELMRNLQAQLGEELQFVGDTRVDPGNEFMVLRDWAQQADLIYILLSQTYLSVLTQGSEVNSNTIEPSSLIHEAYFFIESLQEKGKKVVPILINEVAWKESIFSPLILLPLSQKPLLEYPQISMAMEEIISATRSIIDLHSNPKAQEIILEEKKNRSGFLDLSDLGLKYIPLDIYPMDWLKILKLDRNQLTRIEYLQNLTILESLSIEKNQLTKIENLDGLVKLKVLNLTENQLTKIENLEHLVELSRLELRHNLIKELAGVSAIKNLEILGVSNNQLTSLEGIEQLKNLSILYASYNQIKEIDPLQNLKGLNRIILTSNQITSIKPLLHRIKEGLFVAYAYDFNEKNNGLFLKDNTTLSEPSLEVIQQGRQAILKYFADADQYGVQKLELVKMILVGNSRVGKTNFSQYLRTGKIDPDSKSTHLLEIEEWNAPFLKSENGILTRVAIFDFGGQDYYHDSHRLYYSHDTAYILLWDDETNNYSEAEEASPNSEETLQFENFPLAYWLESIKYNLRDKSLSEFRKDSSKTTKETKERNFPPILILQNKIDKQEAKLNQKSLCEAYPMIWGFFNISLLANKRTLVLSELLSEYFSSLNLSGRNLVNFEMKVIRHFLDQPRNLVILSLDQFFDQCIALINDPEIDFNRDNAMILAQILSNSGLILFEKTGEKEGWIYTNIAELNKLVKEVMEKARSGSNKGIFSRDQIKAIPHHQEVLGLLVRNNSIIEINEQEFLAPQFLPVSPNESTKFFLSGFSYTQVRYVYKAFFHKTLMLNLFAEFLQKENIDSTQGVKSFPFWRNGIIVKKGDGISSPLEMVFVEFLKNKQFGLVNIKTMKPFNKHGLEKEIIDSLDKLNNEWCSERQMSSDSIHFFDVDKLKKQASNKQYSYTHTLSYDNTDLKRWEDWKSKTSVDLQAEPPHKVFSVNDFRDIENFDKLPKKLFISYSSKNSAFIRRFITHLQILKSTGILDPWYDRMIEPGTRWDDSIREEMNQSDLIVFMLSPDFLATDYVMKVEVPLALEKFGPGRKLFFVQLLPCNWNQTALFRFQQTGNTTETDKNVITVGSADNDAKWKEVVDELLKKIGAPQE